MVFDLGDGGGLAYEYRAPARAGGLTFACFNPLSGDKAMWEEGIGPALAERGHGLLTWNLRGQAGSPFQPCDITARRIVEDARRLIAHVAPPRPVYVGLSIGGLFAAQVHAGADGPRCVALVLINTLREIGPRLAWINDAVARLAATGGLDLLRDAYMPLLMNEEWLAEHRSGFLKDEAYTPLPVDDGALLLLEAGAAAAWDVDWSALDVPVLNITGAQDRIFRDEAVIDRLLRGMARVRALEYADAGHMVPVERPARLAADLLAFAESL